MAQPDELESRIQALEPEDLQRGLAVFRRKLKDSEASSLNTCVHCGICAESCHVHLADGEPDSIPAAKLEKVAAVFKRHFARGGRLVPALVGARDFDRDMVRSWADAVFGRCTLCGRCTLNCAVGINIPAILRAARGTLTSMGVIPEDLEATVSTALETGNNMGISQEDFLETVSWLEEELQMETGDPTARIPMGKPGAKILFTVNPREPKFFPLSLLASAKVFHAAKEDWTLSSEGWDLTNYGLFSGDPRQGALMAQRTVDAMERLGAQELVLGECGHGFASGRWEAPEWLERTPAYPVRSILEVIAEYLQEGRIQVDPKRNAVPVTLHDPCNLVRHGGVSEPQRAILRQTVLELREMTPNREKNYCCGGGGGQLAMSRYHARRLKAGGIKAEQIRKTGAKVVVAPCHNCIDQLSELNKEYKLNVSVRSVTEMVADALVLQA